jgi:hypothetical protein
MLLMEKSKSHPPPLRRIWIYVAQFNYPGGGGEWTMREALLEPVRRGRGVGRSVSIGFFHAKRRQSFQVPVTRRLSIGGWRLPLAFLGRPWFSSSARREDAMRSPHVDGRCENE